MPHLLNLFGLVFLLFSKKVATTHTEDGQKQGT
jgi:hypothetical protein